MKRDPFEPIKIMPLKGYYVVISKYNRVSAESVSCSRTASVNTFLLNSSLTWKQCYKEGWRCIKVNIEFDPT